MRWLAATGAAGAVVLAGGAAAGNERAWAGLLLAAFGILTLGLAGLVFIASQYASGASWSVAFRRVPEAMTAAIPIGGAVVAALILLAPGPYPWSHGLEAHGAPGVADFKIAWLSWPFVAARAVIVVLLWTAFARAIVANSRRQDTGGGERLTARNIRLSIIGLLVFAVTFSVASFDWIMSLEPEWYSTIFAIYQFAGLFSSGLAVMVLVLVRLRRGPLRNVVTDEHLHDLGKLLFAFCTFWMYIWFSQYMLIWYANIPEEAVYYVTRTKGAWVVPFVAVMLLNWAIPFLALLRRSPKRRPELLARVAAVVLLGRWLDLYVQIVPPFAPAPVFGVWEAAAIAALAGAGTWIVARALGGAPLVASGDPRLAPSLHYHS